VHTQCPECKTRFRVNDDQLRVAQGQVRCSRCHILFNALEFLRTPTDDSSPPVTNPEIEETATDPGVNFLSEMDEFSDLKAQITDDLCPFEDSETVISPEESENTIDDDLSEVLRELEAFEINAGKQTAAISLDDIEEAELDEPITLDPMEVEAQEPPVSGGRVWWP